MNNKCKQPYTFVPVVTERISTHEAIFHDGKRSENKSTGILKCTLQVKTPMIVGHFQYHAESIKNSGLNSYIRKEPKIIDVPGECMTLPESWGACGYSQEHNKAKNFVVNREKSILEPLFLDENIESPVLISGTGLKGMIRQSIGAMTNSPMERVEEKQFSYRPGLVFQKERSESKYKILKAIARNTLNYKKEDDQYVGEKQTLKISLEDSGREFNLSEKMVEKYWKTINTYSNKETPPDIAKDSTIFVEYNETIQKILSFGNHEQYRWIYASTTTLLQNKTNGLLLPRKQLTRNEDEIVDLEQSRLTAVRSLMGYVDGGEEGSNGDLNLGIGDGKDYARLAGRISVNTAVEVLNKKNDLSRRFVKLNGTHNIPLKILAEPKSSAVECYLDQTDANGKILNTYGDFSGFSCKETELAGRKFYFRAHTKISDFTLSQTEEDHAVVLAGKQSTIARYISKEGVIFKFSVRFKDLTDAELGLLISALSPNTVENKNGINQQYWQQLGHGRPLGMGGVDITIDSIEKINNQLEWESLSAGKYLQAFKGSDLYDEERYKDWLAICKPLDSVIPYMKTTQHSDLRKAHIKAVRKID